MVLKLGEGIAPLAVEHVIFADGALVGADVSVLEAACAELQLQRLSVDLRGLTDADARGIRLLRRLLGQGVRVVGMSDYLRFLVFPPARADEARSVDQSVHERRVQAAERMASVGRLAAGIAHDFANVLSIVVASSTAAKDALPEGHAAREDMAHVLVAARSGVRIVRRLLAFLGRRPVTREPVDVNLVLRELEKLLSCTLGKSIVLRTEEAPMPAVVLADPGELDQLFINLALNARDAMPGGGTLRIRSSVEPAPSGGSMVRIDVSDDGEGIAEAHVGLVFEPFFSTKEAGGHGLGLWSARAVVERLGGTIDFSSRVGVGTTFSVLLPLAQWG
jgi:two-component system cell cycle sensor histidine kinase/response regulator CckA